MDVVDKYGFFYGKIRKVMYGIKQSARIDFDCLLKLMKTHEYHPLRSNSGMWCHETLPTKFALFVGDFGIKYTNPDCAHHLVYALKKYYTISIYWIGKHYCGLNLDWNHDKKYTNLSIPGYITKSLHKFQHPTPKRPQHAPHDCTAPAYGSRFQFPQTEPDITT